MSFIPTFRKALINSLRHVTHGLVNILASVVQAIPIVWTVIALVHNMKTGGNPSELFDGYKNDQSHKFFGYRTIRDDTWAQYDGYNIEKKISAENIPAKAWKRDVLFGAV